MNPDGFGITWRKDNTLHTRKYGPGKEEYARFLAVLKEVDSDSTIEYAAHYRKATHGAKCIELSHPFQYDDPQVGPVVLFHNGIIDIKTTKGESDTSQFVKDILSKLPSRWWDNDAIRTLVEGATGWSRFLLMTETETVRLRIKDWHNIDGLWYSAYPLPSKQEKKAVSVGSPVIQYTKATSWGEEITNDEDDFEEGIITASTSMFNRDGFNGGHEVTKFDEEQAAGYTWGKVVCEDCFTEGDYYVIDGKTYMDLKHVQPDDNDDDDDISTEGVYNDHGVIKGTKVG